MKDLAAREAEWVSEYSVIPTPHERLHAIAARTNRRHVLTAEEKQNTERVPGCVSAVWVIGSFEDGVCSFRCDADSPMVKGLVALLCDFHSGATPAEIQRHECKLIEELGFARMLTPTRLNGLAAVLQWIRSFAGSR